jgi:tRNA(Arg) A34 adenosine deaminase TadA
MQAALIEAQKAALRDEVPIGAVLIHHQTGHIIAQDGNRSIEYHDPTAHAEMLVIRAAAAQLGQQRLPEYDLFVTLEPCTMCSAAISFARIRRLVFAATDPKGGAVISGVKFFNQPTCHHKIIVEHDILSEPSAQLLKDFFKQKRNKSMG